MILYINSCVRAESRTNRLALALLKKLGDFEEVKLSKINILPLDEERLNYRTNLINAGDFDDGILDLAKQFASADTIVISAPFWDGSFPALLKIYFENIFVNGIVFKYDENGCPNGLCKAKKIYYVATAGGKYDPRFSFEHVKDLANNMFGINDVELIYAEFLDIVGNDAEKILAEKIGEIETLQF